MTAESGTAAARKPIATAHGRDELIINYAGFVAVVLVVLVVAVVLLLITYLLLLLLSLLSLVVSLLVDGYCFSGHS